MSHETKVGLLFIATVISIIIFSWMLGFFDFIRQSNTLQIGYNFAGGIEKGSPVRAMGIKVGKVDKIEFVPGTKISGNNGETETVNLLITVSIHQNAWPTIGQDSQFYINMAGVIGERFLEISPKSPDSPTLKVGTVVRGEDPPRIDQLLSQGYGLAGKIMEMVEANEGSIMETLEMGQKLVTQLHHSLILLEKITANHDIGTLVEETLGLTQDLRQLISALNSNEAKETGKLIQSLLERLEPLDEKALRKFLQKEGVRARLF